MTEASLNFTHVLQRFQAVARRPLVAVEPYTLDAVLAVADALDAGCPAAYMAGDASTIKAACTEADLSPDRVEVVSTTSSVDAVTAAAHLVLTGEADFVVKGSLSTGTLLKGLLSRDRLGIGRLASHIYIIEAPAYGGRTVVVTDAGVNLNPDLLAKTQLVENVADVFALLDLPVPRVAALSAAESVRVDLQSGVDAALLTVMSRRGQLGRATVDGPMSIDAALSTRAAANKDLIGPVAGQADVLLAPGIDAANMFAKALIGDCGRAMGVIVGGRVPIALPSRGDSADTRTNSVAFASFLASAQRATHAA